MKSPDDAIDQILKGLRETEPPPGIERRTLEAVQMRLLQKPTTTLALASILIRATPWTLAAAGVVVVSIAASVTLHRRHPGSHEMAGLKRQSPPLAAPAALIREEVARTSHRAHPHHLVTLSHPRSNVAKPQAAIDEDSIALSEMNAPSRPAPPMPLTEQEKLLLRLLHQGDQVEMAMLDRSQRTGEEANDRAEFDRFFAPPALDTKPLSMQDKPVPGENK